VKPPEIISVHVTDWNNDPWTRGAYSTLGVGATPDDRNILGTLINRRLVFAGEHTSVDYPATMHGAYNSGKHSAIQLIAAQAPGTVLVIGAGISGLSAAQSLRLAGWTVTVLEAASAVGGRARTQKLANGLTIHPGAAWIHGPIGNPIADLAQQLGVSVQPNWPNRVAHVYRDVGMLDPQGAEVEKLDATVQTIHDRLADAANHSMNIGKTDTNLGDALQQVLLDIPEERIRVAVKTQLDMHFESLMAADLENLSLRYGDEPYAYPGGDAYITSYLAPLTDHLAADLNVIFDSIVATIATGPDEIAVTTTNGLLFAADAVVVTLPLGVLKANTVEFAPPLPAPQVDAISKLALGQKCKVYVQFADNWWGNTQKLWVYPQAESTSVDAPTQWSLWVDASHPQTSQVHVLCGFLGGRAAGRVQEQAKTAEGIAALTKELRDQFSWSEAFTSRARRH
jgi:monoamine oxidase